MFPTTSAALYSLEWNTHWSTTLIGLFTVDKCAILSSDNTHNPNDVIIVSIPWLISGSTWYGLPASTIPFILFCFIYSSVSSPFFLISSLYLWYSFSASWTASFNSFFVKLYSLKSSISDNLFSNPFFSKGKNGFINFISLLFNSSTLFFNTSEYDTTIGQL